MKSRVRATHSAVETDKLPHSVFPLDSDRLVSASLFRGAEMKFNLTNQAICVVFPCLTFR